MTIRSLLPTSVAVIETDDPPATGMLHPGEAAAVANAVAKRRSEFTAGRLCAREALSEFGVTDFPLLPGPDRAPVWPTGFVGSLSHCEGYCAAAVARRVDARGLGIDVECVRRLESSIVDRICTPAELRSASESLPVDRETAVIAIFSAHESSYKCYYPLAGAILEHEDLEVTFGAEGRFSTRLVRPDRPAADGVREFEGRLAIAAGYVFTAVRVA